MGRRCSVGLLPGCPGLIGDVPCKGEVLSDGGATSGRLGIPSPSTGTPSMVWATAVSHGLAEGGRGGGAWRGGGASCEGLTTVFSSGGTTSLGCRSRKFSSSSFA